MKRTLLLFTTVVAIAGLLVSTEVLACECPTPPYPLEALTAPRECTLTFGTGKTVNIVAGPGYSEFPKFVTCPSADCPGSETWNPSLVGDFLMWEYKLTYANMSVYTSYALFSVASDIEIDGTFDGEGAYLLATPSVAGDGDCKTDLGNHMYESRILRYYNDTKVTPYTVKYYTPTGIGPRVATAGVKYGFSSKYCLLQGAGSPLALDSNKPIAASASFDTPGCTVSYKVDPQNRVITGSIVVTNFDPLFPCVVTDNADPLLIEGKPILYFGGPLTWAGGSCKYCVANCQNTSGGAAYITCTSCCVSKATNKCVAKPADPSTWPTFCKEGTY